MLNLKSTILNYTTGTKQRRHGTVFACVVLAWEMATSFSGDMRLANCAIDVIGFFLGFAIFIALAAYRDSVLVKRRMPVDKGGVLATFVLLMLITNIQGVIWQRYVHILFEKKMAQFEETIKHPVSMPASLIMTLAEKTAILPGDTCSTICFTKKSEMDALALLKDAPVSVSLLKSYTQGSDWDSQTTLVTKSDGKPVAIVTLSMLNLITFPLPVTVPPTPSSAQTH